MIHYSIFCNDDITEIFLRDALHYHYITKIADVMTLHYTLLFSGDFFLFLSNGKVKLILGRKYLI